MCQFTSLLTEHFDYLRLRLHVFVANVRCYGCYYYHNVFFALTATILFRKQLHLPTYLSCSSYW